MVSHQQLFLTITVFKIISLSRRIHPIHPCQCFTFYRNAVAVTQLKDAMPHQSAKALSSGKRSHPQKVFFSTFAIFFGGWVCVTMFVKNATPWSSFLNEPASTSKCVCVGAAFESTKKYNSAAQVHLSLSPSPLPHPYLLLLPPSLGRQMHAREKNI